MRPSLSRLHRHYLVRLNPPMKFRVWDVARALSRNARLTIPYGGGGWISLHEDDWLQRQILFEGSYEPEVWDALSQFAKAGDVIWDVGAHIGSFAINALTDPRGFNVHCFEPNPITAAILRANIHLNSGSCTCHQVALSDRVEDRSLVLSQQANSGMATLVLNRRSHSMVHPVHCETVDSMLGRGFAPRPDLLKIDVEGWEVSVLRGASTLLSEHPPKAIVVESYPDSTLGMGDQDLAGLLDSFGYGVTWLRRPEGTVTARENYLAIQEGL